MSVFDNIRDKLLSYFNTNNEISSDWIKINDGSNPWTVEDFSYKDGVPLDGVDDHCWKCITVNQCWFKNEDNKKPEEFDYSKYSLIETPMEIRGLYHPNCHCKKLVLKTPKVEDIKFLMLQGKIDYFFKDKLNWYYSWGYKDEDREEFINLVKRLVAQSFVNGDYECEQHSQYGYKINIFITIPGKNEKFGRFYKTWSCYMIFPNGKLKLNTVIGGKEE